MPSQEGLKGIRYNFNELELLLVPYGKPVATLVLVFFYTILGGYYEKNFYMFIHKLYGFLGCFCCGL